MKVFKVTSRIIKGNFYLVTSWKGVIQMFHFEHLSEHTNLFKHMTLWLLTFHKPHTNYLWYDGSADLMHVTSVRPPPPPPHPHPPLHHTERLRLLLNNFPPCRWQEASAFESNFMIKIKAPAFFFKAPPGLQLDAVEQYRSQTWLWLHPVERLQARMRSACSLWIAGFSVDNIHSTNSTFYPKFPLNPSVFFAQYVLTSLSLGRAHSWVKWRVKAHQ